MIPRHLRLFLLPLVACVSGSYSVTEIHRRDPPEGAITDSKPPIAASKPDSQKIDPLLPKMPTAEELEFRIQIDDSPVDTIAEWLGVPSFFWKQEHERYVIILLGPKSEWNSLWEATWQELFRAPDEKRPENRLVKKDVEDEWPWRSKKERTFHEYDVLQKAENPDGKLGAKKAPLNAWFNDLLKTFRFPEKNDPKSEDPSISSWGVAPGQDPETMEILRTERFRTDNTFAFFLKNLSLDPTSVKNLANILGNETIYTIGTDSNGTPRAKRDHIRKMRFMIGVDYPFVNRTEEASTGNPMFDLTKKKREEILKALQKSLGIGVMQYVGRIIALSK